MELREKGRAWGKEFGLILEQWETRGLGRRRESLKGSFGLTEERAVAGSRGSPGEAAPTTVDARGVLAETGLRHPHSPHL